ncbi:MULTISPECIES: hypothetical protein [Kitasatospora]|uniref:Uncharacterized protein n=1 Tax=Kitasatospora cathayae TaxID=3004092 RepID=A0ABY7QBI6_9ACTN|nr:hypothetical protein [Kitasatospora sp. HUAS 3-15]WBP90133.1 hypothetical protein O1G21_32615 [Kitasatospora sp. HUAS 3-15]
MTLALLGLHLAVTGVLLPCRLAAAARLQAAPRSARPCGWR